MADGTKWDLSWKRPDSVPYPKVWHTFEAISEKTGCKHKIEIQDIPSDRFEECKEFLSVNFIYHETLNRATELWKEAESVMAFQIIWQKLLEQKISLIAVIDEEDNAHSKSKIIGILLLGAKTKKDPPTKTSGIILNKIIDLMDHAMNGCDPFQLLESESYLYHFGVAVAPQYYGLGIGYELELRSSAVGKACGIRGSCIVFTSPHSRSFYEKLRCSFIFVFENELRYDEYKDENGEVIVPNVDGTSAIAVIWKYS